MRTIICCVLAFLLISRSPAQNPTSSGTEFWLNYMENLDLGGNGPPYLYIMASSYVDAQVALEVPSTGDVFPYTVSAGHTTAIFVPSNYLYPVGAEAYYDDGLRITSDQPITVQAYHHRLYFSEATLVLPIDELGTEYMVVAHVDDSGAYPSEFTIEATQAATSVEIVPSVQTISMRPAGEPFTIDLDEGEVFQLQSFLDLTGTTVRSLDPTKPIAVFGGAKIANIGCGATDHVWSEMMPTRSWGRHFAVAPYKDRGGDIFKITALHDNTTITTTTGATITLNATEHADQFLTVPALIDASDTIAVVQFNEGESCNGGAVGDACMAFVPPSDHMTQHTLFRSLSGPGSGSMGWITEYTLNIVTQGGASVGSFVLDGVNISSQFVEMASAPGWYYARMSIDEGEHELIGSQPFQAQSSGFGSYTSYTFYTGYNEEPISTGLPIAAALHLVDINVIAVGEFVLPLPSGTVTGLLRVYDAVGKCVLSHTIRRASAPIDVRSLAQGGYVYRCSDMRGTVLQQGRLIITP